MYEWVFTHLQVCDIHTLGFLVWVVPVHPTHLAHEGPARVTQAGVAAPAVEARAEHVVRDAVQGQEQRAAPALCGRDGGELDLLEGVRCRTWKRCISFTREREKVQSPHKVNACGTQGRPTRQARVWRWRPIQSNGG